jgi:hypothetical protein
MPDAVFHNADLYPPRFDRALAITYVETERSVTESSRPAESSWHWLSARLGLSGCRTAGLREDVGQSA